ncbi:hypothetical protein F4775DRAFT_563861 [Biscogniauxia sp. FL1348]|nr:hypothetical protein F4775DRAFT_563861 [Biscogniauxia sp. FL1348]
MFRPSTLGRPAIVGAAALSSLSSAVAFLVTRTAVLLVSPEAVEEGVALPDVALGSSRSRATRTRARSRRRHS